MDSRRSGLLDAHGCEGAMAHDRRGRVGAREAVVVGDAGRHYLGIDPGPTTVGLVEYADSRVVGSASAMPVSDALTYIAGFGRRGGPLGAVCIERVQSYGIAGATLLATSEVVGRLQQHAIDFFSEPILLYRRDICSALQVTGKGSRDALVRQRLIEMHGGSREVAVGRKRSPGPLYGVAGHAWQALAVIMAAQALGLVG